jgi:hypothetical protein
MRRLVALICLLCGATPMGLFAQDSSTVRDTTTSQEALRVFVDCNRFCDFDFFRREITFVNYMRDRADAQVQVIITARETGGGGTENTLKFIGLREFVGVEDELRYVSNQNNTEDEIRQGLARTLKLGLLRYVARLPLADRLAITFTPADSNQTSQKPHDRWNYWVFSTRVIGYFSGETSTKSRFLNGSVSANRTTEDWKLNLSFNGSSDRSSFALDSVTTFVSRSSRYSANALVVRSLGAHWSAGFRSSARSSVHENEDLVLRAAPAVEFDVYPYAESTRRQVTLLYEVGVNYANYTDRTIFGRTHDRLMDQSLTLAVNATQPWGSVNGSVSGSTYFYDFSKNRLEVFTGLNIRLFKGLGFNMFGSYSRVRDQLNIVPPANVSPEEILLQLKELATAYRYQISMGLSYTFGSIYNNVVNPLFGGGGFFFFNN